MSEELSFEDIFNIDEIGGEVELHEKREEKDKSSLYETYFKEMKSYLAENGYEISEDFWNDPRAKEMVTCRFSMRRRTRTLWYRCPWCKKVPKSAIFQYVFYHMYSRRSKKHPTRYRRGGGCENMPEGHKKLNANNQLVDRDDFPNLEKEEKYFYVDPEEISPVVAVQSKRFSRARKMDSVTGGSIGRKPEKSPRQSMESEENEPNGEIEPSDCNLSEYTKYKNKTEKFFKKKGYHIPDNFWKDVLVIEVIQSRIGKGISPDEFWYRCPWCKKTGKSASVRDVFYHMYQQKRNPKTKKSIRKGCPSMPEEHKKLYLNRKLVRHFNWPLKSEDEEYLARPEEISPQMVLETDFLKRCPRDYEPLKQQREAGEQKTHDDIKDQDIKPNKFNLDIDMSAGPSQKFT